MRTGLDRLLRDAGRLAGRRYGLLAHGAAVDHRLRPAHLALTEAGQPPERLFGPEHGYYGVEQDMIAAEDATDPWTGLPIVSLYGADERSLVPREEAFAGLDLLVIDLQDVGARYYTYAATAVWAAEVAVARGGCEVWVLDRPNPLGGEVVEGNVREAGFESFVGAFALPARHGLTLGELVRLEAGRRGWEDGLRVVEMEGWERGDLWAATGRPWIAPSPNLPSLAGVFLYPGLCLVEATQLSEGRGTTRPFQLVGAPGVDPVALAEALIEQQHPGVAFLPTYFRPQFQKHAGEVCGGVQIEVLEPAEVASYELGVELIATLHELTPDQFAWRDEPYEFVSDRPAIDLLTGSSALRLALAERGDFRPWMSGWEDDEQRFLDERGDALLYG